MASPKKPEPVATPPASGPDTPPASDTRLAALERELDDVCGRHAIAERELASTREALRAVEAKAQRLADDNRRLRDELEAQTARFDRAWQEREYSSAQALPEASPVRGRVLVARHTIRLRGPQGEPLVLRAGQAVPEGASLDGLPPNAFEER